jgi:Mg/Co/Ni transporter MgtE
MCQRVEECEPICSSVCSIAVFSVSRAARRHSEGAKVSIETWLFTPSRIRPLSHVSSQSVTPTCQLLLPEVEELIKAGQYGDLREALHHLHPADVSDIVHELGSKSGAIAFRFLQRDDAASAFAYMSPEDQEAIIAELGTEDSAKLIEQMGADDRARVVDELPEAVAQRVLTGLTPESRKEVQAILGYPERSVGRIMTPDYVRIRPEWSVDEALDHIRRYGRDAETLNVVYVIDDAGRLIDDLRLRQLIFAERHARIEDLMHEIKGQYPIVIVTHNMQQAARVSDRTAFFNTEVDADATRPTGVLVEYDSTRKIFSTPSDPRTEQYISGRMG